MGKKTLKLLPSLFRTKESAPPRKKHHHHHHNPWSFMSSCGLPTKTLSFGANDDIYKTINSVFFYPSESTAIEKTPEFNWFTTTSSESATSFSTETEELCFHDGESLELLVRGVMTSSSERLFFEPGDTNSILEKAKANGFPFKESVVLAMESEDPYEDFKRSMEEMVESHGVKDWEGLEELLSWYLKVNGKKNHGFILGAFVDLLISIATNSNNCCSDQSTSYSSAVCSFASSPSYLQPEEGHQNQNDIDHGQDNTVTS